MKSFIQQNGLIDMTPQHSFHITLVDFDQIIINDFIQLEAFYIKAKLNDSMTLIFFQGIKQIWNNFCIISLKPCTEKT